MTRSSGLFLALRFFTTVSSSVASIGCDTGPDARPAVRLAFKLTDYSGENLKAPRFLKVPRFRHVLGVICVVVYTKSTILQ